MPALNHRLVLENPHFHWPADVIAEAEEIRDAELRQICPDRWSIVADDQPDDDRAGTSAAVIGYGAIGIVGMLVGTGVTLIAQWVLP